MKHDDAVYLHHIADAITTIESYLQDVDERTFYAYKLVQDGVIRELEIIGEACRHVSPEARMAYPQVPWQDMAGMRNKLIHDYFGVDLEKVWLTASEDLPQLKSNVEQILLSWTA